MLEDIASLAQEANVHWCCSAARKCSTIVVSANAKICSMRSNCCRWDGVDCTWSCAAACETITRQPTDRLPKLNRISMIFLGGFCLVCALTQVADYAVGSVRLFGRHTDRISPWITNTFYYYLLLLLLLTLTIYIYIPVLIVLFGNVIFIVYSHTHIQHIYALEQAIAAEEISIPVYFSQYNEDLYAIIQEISNIDDFNAANNQAKRESALSEIMGSISANGYQVSICWGWRCRLPSPTAVPCPVTWPWTVKCHRRRSNYFVRDAVSINPNLLIVDKFALMWLIYSIFKFAPGPGRICS